MIINEGVFTPTFSTNMIIQDQITLGWPKHIAAYLGKGYLGLSFSDDRDNAYLAACGEYAERAFFNKRMRGVSRKKLSDLPDSNRQQLYSFIKQMCPLDLVNEINTHEFDLCLVESITDDETLLVPTAVISIGEQQDSQFIVSRDTTGNSVHFDENKCFNNSLLEFVERQSLITSFLYSKGQTRFDIDDLSIFGSSCNLIKKILCYGEVYAADISLFENAYTILLCFSSSKENASVMYSVGCSSSYSIKEAFEKSARELYSSFVTMLSIYDEGDGSYYEEYEKNMDYYLKLYYDKNHPDTYKEFGVFFNNSIPEVRTSEAVFCPKKHFEDLLEDISEISGRVYSYRSEILFPRKEKLYVCKIFSLDMFYNMDISRKCNLNNKITSLYGGVSSRDIKFIPFP
ncbi:hypothetical protein BFW38_05120 [Terasakiispira papahanaumokuakeensis]|uniref:YcaO domain-containing protein n=1 Tax=Terasakiispira papahanaumokuakeensis TaxID=197479 RepID=A0A1E2V7Q5_9GAMM|nr:YcaO-like family protein [Terasakiispira papahanaumokuakeensis]ODC03017.1 hypothetical protein BFW38_05120 [Terasakiispira papahanaumokuakeensis]